MVRKGELGFFQHGLAQSASPDNDHGLSLVGKGLEVLALAGVERHI